MTAMLIVLLGTACSEPSPMELTPRPDVPSAEATPPSAGTPPATPDVPAEPSTEPAAPQVGSEGLHLPALAKLGTPYTVLYSREGRNGCYRQSEVTTTLNTGEKKVFHRYTTSFEGEICTEALVPGGFSAEVNLPERGVWQGLVLVDGTTLAAYQITVE